MLQRIQHEHTPYLAESALGGLRKPQHPPNTDDCDRGQDHGAKIISMSLYGGHNIYDVGALRNAKLAKEYMPGWRVRVYANASELRQEVIVELGELHCRIPLFYVRGRDSHRLKGLPGVCFLLLLLPIFLQAGPHNDEYVRDIGYDDGVWQSTVD